MSLCLSLWKIWICKELDDPPVQVCWTQQVMIDNGTSLKQGPLILGSLCSPGVKGVDFGAKNVEWLSQYRLLLLSFSFGAGMYGLNLVLGASAKSITDGASTARSDEGPNQ